MNKVRLVGWFMAIGRTVLSHLIRVEDRYKVVVGRLGSRIGWNQVEKSLEYWV